MNPFHSKDLYPCMKNPQHALFLDIVSWMVILYILL